MLKLILKMKNVLNIVALIFSAFILFSCEPGRDENGDLLFGVIQNPETGGGNGGAAKLLKKMTTIDADQNISTFSYNYKEGKLESIIVDEEGETSDLLLTYDKDKISKMVMTQTDGSNIITTTSNLIYTNGQLTGAEGQMESGGEELFKNTSIFTYSGTVLKKIETSIKQKDPENPETYVEAFKQVSDILFQGDNMVSWKMTMTTNAPPPLVIPPVVFDVKFSNYDTFKNPLATLPREFNIAGAHLLSGTNSVQGLSKNNYKTASVTAEGTTQNVTYVYEYDSDGYPKSATSAQGTLKYEYQ